MQTAHCLNCGQELTGNFCSGCGQKKYEHSDRSIRNFFTYFFNEYFSWDSKFFSSVKYILFKPGYLTQEYFHGRTEKYITPIKLYLCVSLVVFLFMSNFDSDVLGSLTDEGDQTYTNYIMKVVREKDVTFEDFKTQFNSEINDKLPIYTLVMVLLFSLPLKLIYITHKRFFVEHLVFSLHFYTFFLICAMVGDIASFIYYDLYNIFLFILPFFYLFISLKRVYKQKFFVTFGETVALYFYYIGLLFVWFFAAFFITSWTV